MMLGAVNDGLDQLRWMMQDQTILLNGVVQYLKDTQTALIEGQSILIAGQKVLLQEILRLHTSLLDGTNIVWQVTNQAPESTVKLLLTVSCTLLHCTQMPKLK